MNNELHIHIRPNLMISPEELLENFPFDPGQSIARAGGDLIIVDLGAAEDTNYVQDWYLNSHEDVMSFYVVGDE
jgi:hypothetical protein